MGQARLIIGNNHGLGMFKVYIIISLIYWGVCIIIEIIINQIEQRFKKGRVNVAKT